MAFPVALHSARVSDLCIIPESWQIDQYSAYLSVIF
jgi:hypothetical protein